MRRSAAFSTLFIISILLLKEDGEIWPASAQQGSEASARHKVIGCAKEPKGECVGDECNCAKWIIEWRDAGGRVWGVSEAKTIQKLIEARDRDLAFERAYASFFHVPFDEKFNNPSQPICDGCRPSAPSGATRSGAAAIQTAASLYDEWTRKVVEGMLSLANLVFGRKVANISSSFGTVLSDYANALRLVNRNLKHLRQDMSFTEQQMGRLTGNLQSSTAELRQATDVMTSAYARLPSDLRNALEGKSSSGPTSTEVNFHDQFRFGRQTARYSAGVITTTFDTSWLKYGGQGSWTARVSDLDLKSAEITFNVICRNRDCGASGEPESLKSLGPEERVFYVLSIKCNGDSDCVSNAQSHIGRIDVSCETRQDCSAFLDLLKGSRKSGPE